MMTSRSRSWRNLIKKPLSSEEVVTILTQLHQMPDRGAALVCCSLVERGLEHAILMRMTKLKKSRRKEIFDGGPLSGFHAKMKVGFALALYGEKGFKELDKMREIRNAFAHAIHNVTFSTPRIKKHCMDLASPNKRIPAIFDLLGHEEVRDISTAPPLTKPRDRYVYAATLFWLLMRYVEPKRPHRPRGMWSEFLIP